MTNTPTPRGAENATTRKHFARASGRGANPSRVARPEIETPQTAAERRAALIDRQNFIDGMAISVVIGFLSGGVIAIFHAVTGVPFP